MNSSRTLACSNVLRYSISIFFLLALQLSYSQNYRRDTTRLNVIVDEIESKLSTKPSSALLLIEEAKAIIKPTKQYSTYHNKVQLFSAKYFLDQKQPDQALTELQEIEDNLEICNKENRHLVRDWLTSVNKSYLMLGDSIKAYTIFEDIANKYLQDKNMACYASVYSELGYTYRMANQFDKAIETAEKAAKLGEKHDSYSALIAYLILQNTYSLKEDYLNALRYAERQLVIAKQIDDEAEIARAKLNLAGIYASIKEEDKAIDYYFEILPYFEKQEDYQRAGKVANSISILFKDQKNYIEAIEYIKKAIAYTKESQAEYSHSLSMRYNVLGTLYQDILDYKLAQSAFKTALEYCEISEVQKEKGSILKYMAHNYELQGHNQLAVDYYDQAIAHLKGFDKPEDLSDAYTKYGSFLVKTGKQNDAIPYLKNAIAIAEENNLPKTVADAHIFLSDAYKKNKQDQKALTHLEKSFEIIENLREKEEIVLLERTNMRYEFNKERLEKDLKIQALSLSVTKKQNKIRNITFLVLFLTLLTAIGLLLAGFFKYRNDKQRAIAEMMINQNELLKEKNAKTLEQKEALLTMNKVIQENNSKLNTELKSKLLLISQQKMMTEKLEKAINNKNTGFKRDLLSILKSQKSDDIWEKIEDDFLETHKEFVAAMTKRFPNLTPNNIKICILVRMGLSNKEIARIRYVQTTSVKVARNRLRKIFGISHTDITLYSFLNSIAPENQYKPEASYLEDE